MSKDLNKVRFTGRLGIDPETKFTPQGSSVTTFRVASSYRVRGADGEDRESTEWFRVVTWNKLAEICAQYLRKGSRVYIEGRLQTRSWDDQSTGQKRYMTEVIANDMIMLDTRRDSLGADPGYAEPDSGYEDIEPEPSTPSHTQQPTGGRASQPGPRMVHNGGEAPARSSQRSTAQAAPRRPAPAPVDEDDLPF